MKGFRPVHERHQPCERHRRSRSHEVTSGLTKPPRQTQTTPFSKEPLHGEAYRADAEGATDRQRAVTSWTAMVTNRSTSCQAPPSQPDPTTPNRPAPHQ